MREKSKSDYLGFRCARAQGEQNKPGRMNDKAPELHEDPPNLPAQWPARQQHTFYGRYWWFSSSAAKRSHAVWACDDEIEKRSLCGAGSTYQEWDDPGDKQKCFKCVKHLKATEREAT